MSRRRFYDGAQHRFEAHDRRWRLIQEKGYGSTERMKAWAAAYLRWERFNSRPHVTLVGNMLDLLAAGGCDGKEPAG